MTLHPLLHELITAQAASLNNLASYKAKSFDGALLWAYKRLKEYEELGLVRKVPFNIKAKYPRRELLYQVTKKGAKLIGRVNEYRFKDHQSYNAINHESMKYDVVISFIRNFPDYNIRVEYEKTLKADKKGIRADIYLVAEKKDGTKSYSFLIETEHKDNLVNSYEAKIIPYYKAIKNGLFKNNNLPENTKVLFVCACSHLSTFLRPLEYKDNEKDYLLSYRQFENLMDKVRDGVKSHNPFRLIPFVEYQNIADNIWRTTSKNKISIID